MPVKPTDQEQEYIARKEFERMQKAKTELAQKMDAEKKQELKDLHYMCCPKCGMDLLEIKYKDILIDKCSGCEGIWLDAGELEAVSAMEKKGLDKLFSVFK